MRVRGCDEDNDVSIQVGRLTLQLAGRLILAVVIGARSNVSCELVARACDRLDLRVGDNVEVDLHRCRGIEAVRDLRDELRSFGRVRRWDVPWRDRGGDAEAHSLVLNREFSDVLHADLGTSARLQLAKLDAKDVGGGLLQKDSSLAIL